MTDRIENLEWAAELIADRIVGGQLTKDDRMEAWLEGKTLTIMFHDTMQFAKFRLVSLRDNHSAADMRGEPK